MSKNKKRINTVKVEQWRQWRRRDRRAIWVIPLSNALIFFLNMKIFPLILPESERPTIEIPTIQIAINFYVGSVLVLMIYFAISRNAKKNIIQNATFNVTEDIDYYREKLSGLSPATISMLVDLEIEPDKDIAASLLRFTLLGILSPEGKILNASIPGLSKSDQYLLQAVERGGMTFREKLEWSREVEEECVGGEYFERRTEREIDKAKGGHGLFIGILKFTLMIVIALILNKYFNFSEGLEIFRSVIEEGASITGFDSVILFLKGFVLFNIILAAILWPYFSSFALTNTKSFKRTFSGNIAAEKIAGMKNFLHDFSNLSEADKHQLLLWDDFLVYAVVLGENSKIVEELLNRKNLSLKPLKFIIGGQNNG